LRLDPVVLAGLRATGRAGRQRPMQC
jgi:hypothetical protein